MDSVENSVDVPSRSYLQNVLPLEVVYLILLILLPLDRFRLRLTCRRMYEAVNNPTVWRSLSFDFYHTPSKQALETTLSFCSSSVKRLEIDCRRCVSRFPWARFIKHISKCSSSLQHLTLLGMCSPLEQIEILSGICNILSHLELEVKDNQIPPFPKFSSLVSVDIRIEKVHEITSLLLYWSKNNFFPKRVIVSSNRFKSIGVFIHDVSSFLQSVAPPSDGKFTFQLQYTETPLEVIPRHSFFEVILENSELFIPVTTCSTTALTPLILVVSNQQCGYRLVSNQLPTICKHVKFAVVAPTLVHLNLDNSTDVKSKNLHEISSQCQNLRSLSLSGCSNLFEDMSGLASVSTNCPDLEGLNITNIHALDNKPELWSILLSFGKLRYLAVEVCSIPLRSFSIEDKLKALLFLHFGSAFSTAHCAMCHMSDACLSVLAQLVPESLKVLWLSELPRARSSITCQGLKTLFSCLPNLQCVSLDAPSVRYLPTDAECYQNIEKFQLRLPQCYINAYFISALIKNRRLTHCYLWAKTIDLDAVSRLVQAPRLVSLCLGLYKKPQGSWRSKVRQAAKISNIPEFSTYMLPHIGMSAPVHPDLMPLQ